jgi:hypothetical protein
MAGAIYIPNLAEVLAGIEATEEQIDFAAKYAISMAGYEVERQAKKNANGPTRTRTKGKLAPRKPTVGPNTITGNLKRSIYSTTRIGFGTYISEVGASMEYARIVDQGGGNWPSGVKYPYLTPAVESLKNSGKLSRTFTMAFASMLKG